MGLAVITREEVSAVSSTAMSPAQEPTLFSTVMVDIARLAEVMAKNLILIVFAQKGTRFLWRVLIISLANYSERLENASVSAWSRYLGGPPPPSVDIQHCLNLVIRQAFPLPPIRKFIG